MLAHTPAHELLGTQLRTALAIDEGPVERGPAVDTEVLVASRPATP